MNLIWTNADLAPGGIDDTKLWPDGWECGGWLCYYHTASPLDIPEIAAATETHTFVAHNAAGFDGPAWERLVGGHQPTWYDTVPCCRAAGLPAGLDALGRVFAGRGKEDDRALRLLCTAKRLGEGRVQRPTGTAPLWEKMLRYNVADVLLLEKVYDATGDYGEGDVLDVDAKVNARGVAVDRELLAALLDRWQSVEDAALRELRERTGLANPRSQPQFLTWLKRQGVKLDALNKAAMVQVLDDPEALGDVDGAAEVVEVIKLRENVVRAGRGKLEAIRDATDADGRVRDTLVYYGAHTGRWSGRNVQPQNFVRGDAGKVAAALDAWQRDRTLPGDHETLSAMVRPVFVAGRGKLAVADYAAIEARGLAWVAGEAKLLEVFARDGDVYLDMARTMFGRECDAESPERQIAKAAILGAGYSMSARKFDVYCRSLRVDLARVGVTADQVIATYRATYPHIVQTWWNYGDAALQAAGGEPVATNRCHFAMNGGALEVTLPSGRKLRYRGARVEDVVPGWARMTGRDDVPARPTVRYEHPRGYAKDLYGGMLAENIVQAICRDLLATALVRCDAAGLRIVLHVHDEIVCEVDSEEEALTLGRIMSEPPAWAAGFPVSVKGYVSARYVKKAGKGDFQFSFSGGARV